VEGTAEFKTEPLKFGECRMFTASRARLGFFAILTQRAERLSDCWGDVSCKNQRTFATTAKARRAPFFLLLINVQGGRSPRLAPKAALQPTGQAGSFALATG
jgi:hypothetical protein